MLGRDGTVSCLMVSDTKPVPVPGSHDGVSVDSFCMLDSHGVVSCWQMGGVWEYRTPVPWSWDGVAESLSVGYTQICVTTLESELYCWGLDLISNSGGVDCAGCTPELVREAGRVAQVSAGLEVTWFRDCEGRVRMIDTSGHVGEPLSLPEPAIDISTGYFGACAVVQSGRVYCWLNPTATLSEFAANLLADQYRGIELGTEPRLVDLCAL
jgi:hypothetical protein